MEVNKRQLGGVEPIRTQAAPRPTGADGEDQKTHENHGKPKSKAEIERAQIAHRNAIDSAQIAHREEVDKARLARRTEIDRYQAAHRAAVDETQSQTTPSPVADQLQLSHDGGTEGTSPERKARLGELIRAFRVGNLNSPERVSLAAEKILLG